MAFIKGCNTVGWLAEKNSKDMGKYGRDEMSAQDGKIGRASCRERV